VIKKLAIGSWAYTFGPYEAQPIPLDTVIRRLGALGFDGIELNGFAPHAHPDLYPTKASRSRLVAFLAAHGLGGVRLRARLWRGPARARFHPGV